MSKTIQDAVQYDYIQSTWIPDLARVRAKRGPGLNKLRTYNLFKSNYGTEDYLIDPCINRSERQCFARLRCGIAPLRIELGRYDHGMYIQADNRICTICNSGVENEVHILLECNFLC